MALTSTQRTIGTHLWAAFSGVALSDTGGKIVNTGDMTAYTTVGPLVMPAADDTAWIYLGVCKDFERDPGEGSPLEIMAPAPGVLRRVNVLRPQSAPKNTGTIIEFGPVAVQLLYRTLALTSSSTTWNPQAGKMTAQCWLNVETYDGTDSSVFQVTEWGDLQLKGPVKFDPKALTEVSFEHMPFYNSLNRGTN